MTEAKVLAHQVVLITGGAGDIGRAVATRLVSEGASVALFDVVEQEVQAAQFCAEIGPSAAFFAGDIRHAEQVERAVEAAKQRFGTIDILINCAGVIRWSTLRQMSDEDWDTVLDINLRGTFLSV